MIKNLFKTFIKFLNATSILITVILIFLLSTIFNNQYLINLLEKENYYSKLEDEITEELSYYVIQSGLDETILNNLVSQEEIKESTLEIINNKTVQQMKNYRQHYETTCFDHCFMVSYFCYIICFSACKDMRKKC